MMGVGGAGFSGQGGDHTIDTHHYLLPNDPPIAPVPDRVTCGPGTDAVFNADPTGTIADHCENVSFRATS